MGKLNLNQDVQVPIEFLGTEAHRLCLGAVAMVFILQIQMAGAANAERSAVGDFVKIHHQLTEQVVNSIQRSFAGKKGNYANIARTAHSVSPKC